MGHSKRSILQHPHPCVPLCPRLPADWKDLDLNSNNVGANMDMLAAGLLACHGLTSLNLSFCGLGTAALDAILKALVRTGGIIRISAANNRNSLSRWCLPWTKDF